MIVLYGIIEVAVRWIVFAGRTRKIVITYEGGRRQVVRCKSFTVKNAGRSVEWGGAYPQPLLMGVDNIVSIYAK